MTSKRLRTVVCALLASGLTAALVVVGCDGTSSNPFPLPGPDGGGTGTSMGPQGTFDGGVNANDAPSTTPQDAFQQPVLDGGTTPPFDSGGF
ncbi:MAG: hypothetical protein QM831_23140 [Kofleriaceae bacterium]